MIGKFFQLAQKNTTIKVEFLAGLTTFLTMAYIIFVNPATLAQAGMDKQALIAVTCLISAASTIAVGLLANAPIAMAPGMGLNAFFAYSLVLGDKISWQTALGVVFLSGVLFFLLTVLGLRKRIIEAIPSSLIAAISVGIGLFITFIGLVNLGLVVKNPVTLVSVGKLTPTIGIGLCGLLVMVFFEIRKVTGALLIGIISSTALAAACGYIEKPAQLFSLHLDVSKIALQLDILAALKWSMFGSIFTLMFMDMFDSVGTLMACCRQANMIDEKGQVKGVDRLLVIDSLATVAGAALGTSTTTAYVESAAGIEQGGRSGLASVVTGSLFLLAVLFVPVLQVVPTFATAPALIMVGLFMVREVKKIDFTDLQQAFPAYIIMVMIALSYSISKGLAFGFISFTVAKLVSGNARDVKPVMWLITLLSVLFFIVD
ncbi:MAG TPA: NCS2 family permease [Sedimentisphaerales bacterium]|nr:NCS2 family permease [Sedimentisphaerales bacterium]